MTNLGKLCVFGVVCMSTAVPAQAGIDDGLTQIMATDSALGDQFGYSVSIDGITAVIGARFDDEQATDAGSVYVFDVLARAQSDELFAEDGAANDWFGSSVAISGETAIIGALRDDDNGSASGSAYLFDVPTGTQLTKLLPDDGAVDDWFGFSVAIDGALAIAGSYQDDDLGSNSGSAYLFDARSGDQMCKLLPEDGAAGFRFGSSVDVGDVGGTSIAVVGAWGNTELGSGAGAAYLFDADTGKQLSRLLADDGAPGDHFGTAVAMSKSFLVVGAPDAEVDGISAGAVYVFDIHDPTMPTQIAKLAPQRGESSDRFGFSVAIAAAAENAIAIIGSWGDDDHGTYSGSIYRFSVSSLGASELLSKYAPIDGQPGDQFGWSVSVAGPPEEETAIVGAWGADPAGDASGIAYVFDATALCPPDLDHDGIVGPADLAGLLGAWGTDGYSGADLTGNRSVGPADLAVLLGAWGPCSKTI